MAEIEVTPEAVSDIDEIYRFGLTTFGLAAAERYHAMIEAVIDRLPRHPDYAPAYPGLRGIRYASAGSPHVFYRPENDTVRATASDALGERLCHYVYYPVVGVSQNKTTL